MRIYRCPKCKQTALAWDARSGNYLCHTGRCGTWFAPPTADEAGRADVRAAIGSGVFEPSQDWFDTKAAIPTVKNGSGLTPALG